MLAFSFPVGKSQCFWKHTQVLVPRREKPAHRDLQRNEKRWHLWLRVKGLGPPKESWDSIYGRDLNEYNDWTLIIPRAWKLRKGSNCPLDPHCDQVPSPSDWYTYFNTGRERALPKSGCRERSFLLLWPIIWMITVLMFCFQGKIRILCADNLHVELKIPAQP